VNVERVLELFVDTESAAGLAVTTLAIVLVAAGLRVIAVLLTRHRFDDDPYRRYWSAKIVTYIIAAIAVVALVALWAPLGGRLSVILGFATAGIAFAMQEVIGALFGWVNILAGRIYTVGDRVEVAGVRGDVIEITPLRTKLFEIGSEPAPNGASASWVSARQPTGRVVTVSNKKTFTEPVFNFSAHLEWIWEEVIFAVGRDADWAAGEAIVLEEMKADEPELRREGEAALARLGERYLLSRSEVEPQTYLRVAAGDIEIVGRFVTRVRGARGPRTASCAASSPGTPSRASRSPTRPTASP
jgi:small-conductance mechanosensitive channel